MHKAISTKVQGKTSFETKPNNVDQTFSLSTFYVVFGFLTQKKEKIDQNQQKEINDRMQKQTNKFQPKQSISKQPNKVTKYRKYWCMDML